MDENLDLVVVTILVGPGMNGHPVTEDVGAFQNLVGDHSPAATNGEIGLNLIFDVASSDPDFTGAKFVRIDKRRQRLTVAVRVPADLSARSTTMFLRQHTEAALRVAEDALDRKRLPGSLGGVRRVLERASVGLPDEPLSETERYRRVTYAHASPYEPLESVAQLDAAGREVGKVDIYADGALDYAVGAVETGSTRLNDRLPGPSDVVRVVDRGAFAATWQAAIEPEHPRGAISVRDGT